MGIKITTEDFIRKAKKVHGDRYDYSNVRYVKSIEKVIITCKIHGDFLQTPNAHLSNYGCRECGNDSKLKWTKEYFISEVLRRNGCFLPYEIVGEYTGTAENIIVENKYGKCSIRANHILNGVIPGIETAINKTEYWKNQAREVHGELYDYSKVNYINSSSKIIIICKKHGEFTQVSNSHLSGAGCGKCMKKVGGLKRSEHYSKNFKDKANKTHKDKYTYYENTVFGAKDYVTICCPIHGDFSQIADNHIRGDGCQKCGSILSKERMRENPTGWGYTSWQKAGEKSKKFDSFKVYIIKCWDDNEEFYKIGKTFKKVDDRFKYKADLPYNYKIVKVIIPDSAIEACKIEGVLKKCNKNNKYIPLKEFGGRYECFQELDLACFEGYNYQVEITD